VFDRDEDAMAVSVVELKILSSGPVARFDELGSNVPAEAVRRVEHQLAGIERGSELRWQVTIIVPALERPQTRRSRNIGGRGWTCAARGARAGDHHQPDRDRIKE
jgi:hypothetical protein